MKTNDLISMLAKEPATLAPSREMPKVNGAIALGMVGSLLLMLLWLGINPTLGADASTEPMFWGKLLYGAALAASLGVAVWQLGMPGRSANRALWASLGVVALMIAVGVYTLFETAAEQRVDLALGVSWAQCPVYVTMLSIPVFFATLYGLKKLAPTRLTLAGFVAGAFSGAVGAFVYALYCTEYDAAFVAIWYTLGVAVPAVIGAIIGRWVLRW
jgi:hypothetical protein